MAWTDGLKRFARRFSRVPPKVPDIGLQAPVIYPATPHGLDVIYSREALFGQISHSAGPSLTRYGSYPATALDPMKVYSIFQDADRGVVLRYGEACMQILQRDGHLFTVDRARRVEVANKDFRVFPGDETDDLAKALAGFMHEAVQNIDSFDRANYSALSKNLVGYACNEIIWAPGKVRFRGLDGRPVVVQGLYPRQLAWVHPKHFHFDYGTDEPLLDMGQDGWLPLPETKFIWHVANGDGIASTRGYIRPVAWLHMMKHQALAAWAVYLNLFGIPNIWAKIPREKWEDPLFKSTLESALQKFGQGQPAVLFDDQDVTIQPASPGGGSNDTHSKHVGFCNAEISKVVQGETLTTELSQTGGYNTSDTHEATMYGTVKADGDTLDAEWRSQLFVATLKMNALGLARALGRSPEEILLACPRCEHVIERDVSPVQAAQILDIGVNKLGVKIGAGQFYRKFGWSPPAPGEEVLKGEPQIISADGAAVGSIDAAEGIKNPKPPEEKTPPASPPAETKPPAPPAK